MNEKRNLTTKETFAIAVQNHQKNNLQVAENLYKETLKTNPNHVDAHNNLGVILLQSGKLQKAKNCYEKAIKINPNFADAHNNLGAVFKQLGEFQKAINCYEKSIKINPNYANAYNNLGNTLKELREYKKAINCYKKAIEIQYNYASAHNNLGNVFRELGEQEKAKDCYQKVIQINPNHADAHNNLGTMLQELGEFQKAISCYEKSIKINPNFVSAHNNLGVIFNELGEYKKAISSHQKAIKIQPNNAYAHNNLGAAFKQLGEDQKAISCYQKAIQIQPNYTMAHSNIGTTFMKVKEFKKAADYFKKVDTSLGKAQFLECTYLSKGVENYTKLLNAFVEKDPTNLRIAALAAYVSKKENIKNIYPFCKNPLDYFFSINLKDEFEFSDQFPNRMLKISEKLGSNWRLKPIVKNGHQSTGNLLDSTILEIVELKKTIEKQINIYRRNYKNSDDYYISRWPTKSKLFGWYIKLKKQGQLKSHMHETGWLSGVFYLKIPKSLKKNEGSINLSLQSSDYPYDKSLPNFYYAPKPFDLILYPSSLFHYTVPFTSNEERHCIAFDLTPK